MKMNLVIEDFEDRKTSAGNRFTRFKTSEGWLNCFDEAVCKKLKAEEGESVCVDVESKPNLKMPDKPFRNIKLYLGEADLSIPEQEVEVKEDVKKPRNGTAMYTSYAKDICVALIERNYDKDNINATELMDKSITLIKQAQEAF